MMAIKIGLFSIDDVSEFSVSFGDKWNIKINSLNHSLNITPKILTGPSTHFLGFPGFLLNDSIHYTLTCTHLSELHLNEYQCESEIPVWLYLFSFPKYLFLPPKSGGLTSKRLHIVALLLELIFVI